MSYITRLHSPDQNTAEHSFYVEKRKYCPIRIGAIQGYKNSRITADC